MSLELSTVADFQVCEMVLLLHSEAQELVGGVVIRRTDFIAGQISPVDSIDIARVDAGQRGVHVLDAGRDQVHAGDTAQQLGGIVAPAGESVDL